jgi:tRNA(Leu) C34 or U34 (ribose-2'-O)-methylase TrmL
MAFTFAQLKTAIQEYTENTETTFVSNVDDFIRAAEDRIFYLKRSDAE